MAHSFGGIVAQTAIKVFLDNIDKYQTYKICSLIMEGTPQFGSPNVRFPYYLFSPDLRALRLFSDEIEDLRSFWDSHIVQEFSAQDNMKRKFFLPTFIIRSARDAFVPSLSAKGGLPDKNIFNISKSHTELAKPVSRDELIYKKVVKQLQIVSSTFSHFHTKFRSNSNCNVKHNLRAKRNYIKRYQIEDEIISAIYGVEPVIFLNGVSGVGKTYLAEEVLHKILNKEDGRNFTHIIFIKTSENYNLNSLFDTIIDIFNAIALRQLDYSQKTEGVKSLLRNSKTIITIDSFEKIRKNKEIREFIVSLPHPTKLLLTSTVKDDFEGIKYIPILKIPKVYIEDFTKQMAERYPQGKHFFKDINWEEFCEISGGLPHIISKIIGLIVRRGYSFKKVATMVKNYSADISFEDRILDFMWEKEISKRGRLIAQSLSIVPCSLSICAI